MLRAIACMDLKCNIGNDNELLIRIPEDLKRFKELTTGSTVIMGYNTLMSLPNSKPLPNRKNIVVTHKEIDIPGCEVVNSIEDIIERFSGENDAWVIGGESIYEQLLPYCVFFHLTIVDTVFKSANKKISTNLITNTFYPPVQYIHQFEHNDLKVFFVTLKNHKYSLIFNTRSNI